MDNVTHILSAIEQGDPQAADQLLPLVYDELRRLAAAKMAREKGSPHETDEKARQLRGLSGCRMLRIRNRQDAEITPLTR